MTEGPTLWDTVAEGVATLLDGSGQARRSDPPTSHEAAFKVKVGNSRYRLLWAFSRNPYGLTAYQANEIAGHVGMEYATRCSELKRNGYLEPTGETRVSPESGMSREVMRITLAGRTLIQELGSPS